MAIERIIIERLISNDETLSSLNLSYKKLTFFDFQELRGALEKNTRLSLLDVSGNLLDERTIKILADLPHITSLIAVNCRINNEGAKIFARNNTFTTLNINNNHIFEEGAVSLAQNTTWVSLSLFRNKIGEKGAAALAKNPVIKYLNIGYNSIHSEGISAFEGNTVLASLVISGNAIDQKSILALSNNQTLTSLDASYNNLNDEVAAAFAKHPALIYLDLSYNQIGFEGANALGGNEKLETLIISHNQLGDGGAIALARHKKLIKLDITRNRIGFEGAHALSHNTNLTWLVLNFNLLGDPGAITLSHNKTLLELYLSYNQIGNIGAIALAENDTLKVLNLNYNKIGEEGKKALTKNKTFSSLIISSEQPPEFTEDNLETIFILFENFLCISSLEGIIQFFNPAFPRILGYTSDELLAKSSLDFLHPEDKKTLETPLESQQPKLAMEHFQNRYRCKDGSYRLIRWSTQIKHHRIYAMGTDITEEQQLAADLEYLKTKNMEIRLQESEAFARQQTAFIAQLSHEVRNPLSSIYGFTEILLDNITSISTVLNTAQMYTFSHLKEEIEKTLSVMKKDVEDMVICLDYQKTILDDNLDLAKITEKKFILKKTPFDLSQEIRNIIGMLRMQAENKGIDVYSHLPEVTRVKGDVMRIKQILVNLITNAIKYTLKGRIDIFLETQEVTYSSRHIKIKVIDTGIGISPEELKTLFQRFSQISGNEYSGSGLGLHLMKNLIHLMGGEISVTSQVDIGSIFTVSLPLEPLTEEENKQLEGKTVKSLPNFPLILKTSERIQKILIVDDNEFNRKVIHKQLIKAGYDCKTASNGREALEVYDKKTFDVILMDIIMPIMDGITATKEIRKREQEQNIPRTPIIAISANALERDREDALESGIDDFIMKPFRKDEIIEKITRLSHYKTVMQVKKVWQIPIDSPFHEMYQLQSALNNITLGKKWGVNLDERMWLVLQNEKEAAEIMDHFKNHGYPAIGCRYQAKMDKMVPVIFLKELDYTKLKNVPPIRTFLPLPGDDSLNSAINSYASPISQNTSMLSNTLTTTTTATTTMTTTTTTTTANITSSAPTPH